MDECNVTFILAPERDADPLGAFRRYEMYLAEEAARFPPGAFALATSDWYLGTDDHRAPHDAWLLGASFEERPALDAGVLSLRVRLLGAYHDMELDFRYPTVFSYELHGLELGRGHGDWRYDEFRLDHEGRLLHEIQWAGAKDRASWIICADDVVFSAHAVS